MSSGAPEGSAGSLKHPWGSSKSTDDTTAALNRNNVKPASLLGPSNAGKVSNNQNTKAGSKRGTAHPNAANASPRRGSAMASSAGLLSPSRLKAGKLAQPQGASLMTPAGAQLRSQVPDTPAAAFFTPIGFPLCADEHGFTDGAQAWGDQDVADLHRYTTRMPLHAYCMQQLR